MVRNEDQYDPDHQLFHYLYVLLSHVWPKSSAGAKRTAADQSRATTDAPRTVEAEERAHFRKVVAAFKNYGRDARLRLDKTK
jgi:hypothetical protein